MGEITYPFPNFNGTTVEVWEWISNFIPHFTGHVIALAMLGLKLNRFSKRGPCCVYIPLFVTAASLTLGQSCDCPSVSEMTLKDSSEIGCGVYSIYITKQDAVRNVRIFLDVYGTVQQGNSP